MEMLIAKKKKINWLYLIFILIISLVGILYFDMIFSLPLFGDAATHGGRTKNILNKGLLNTKLFYPPLYHILQAVLFSIFGEKGMNSIVFLGVSLIAFSVFLLCKELTDKTSIALLSVIIVLASPKVIFYSARLYMEILLSGLFVFTIFLLVRFIKIKSAKNLILLAIFTAITASIKQQGLFILFPSILLFLCCFSIIDKRRKDKEKIQNKLSIKHIVIYFLIFLLLISPAYFVQFHNYGRLTPGLEEFKIINLINRIGQKISGYKEPVENIEFNKKWGQRLKEIRKKYYSIGVTRAESRHIWPLDPLTSWNGFIKANGLYLEGFRGGSTTKGLANFMNFLMLSGLILFVLNIIFKNKILKLKYRDLQIYFLIFLLIFLAINYILFLRSTDQMRYHLFIPIIFSVFPAIGIYFLISIFILRNNFSIYYIRIISIFLILASLLTPLIIFAYEDSTSQKGWHKSQLYRPSIGGIASVQEAGEWLNNHTNENDLIWQTCGGELFYYSERKVIGNFWFYFLNESELREIFKDQNVKYIVIFDNQIVLDEEWENLCWVPESFAEKIRKIYPEVYKTSFGDIKIYRV